VRFKTAFKSRRTVSRPVDLKNSVREFQIEGPVVVVPLIQRSRRCRRSGVDGETNGTDRRDDVQLADTWIGLRPTRATRCGHV